MTIPLRSGILQPATVKATLKGHSKRVRSGLHGPTTGGGSRPTSDDNNIKIWDSTTGHCIATLKGHGGSVPFPPHGPSDGRIASGSDDEAIKIWDPRLVTVRTGHEGHSDWVRSVALSSDGRLVLVYDKTIKIWDTATGHVP